MRAVLPGSLDLLTGTAPRRTGPLVAVKVDNAELARASQRGLRSAALVYQELVEGGSTRLLAVLESDVAGTTEIGPVRSVRESDLELLREFGPVVVGYSGGNAGVRATIRQAVAAGRLLDGSYDALPGAYRLGSQRADARNFFTSAARISSRRPGSGPRDIGLRFGTLPAGAVPTATLTATFSRQSAVRARWDAASGTWVLSQAGTVLPVAPRNIVVQTVSTRASRYVDVHGMPTPYTVTLGSGSAWLLRDGRRVAGRWVRQGYGATRFVDAAGSDLLLHAGPSWVLLLPTSGGVAFG